MKKFFLTLSFILITSPSFAAINSQALLKDLVMQPSGSKNTAGVQKVLSRVKRELEVLGFNAKYRTMGKHGPMLLAEKSGAKREFITFVMHADTVYENSNVQWVEKDGKVHAPGVVDDKGGIVVALKGLELYLKDNNPKYSLRIVVSPSEEIGSPGYLDDFRQFGKDSFMVLGFESALADGSIIESRRGDRWYHIKVSGKEAHAGRGHQEGVNACHELSIKLDKLQKLTDYSKNVTVSIGHMEGGKDKFNIVCGHAEAKVDTRFADMQSSLDLHGQIDAILKQTFVKAADGGEPTTTTYELADDCPAFSKTKVSGPYIEAYTKIASEIEGAPVGSGKSGGAADTNYMSRPGLIVIDGLGAKGGNIHTKEEFIELSSLKTRSEALAKFLLGL